MPFSCLLPLPEHDHLVRQHLHILDHVVHVARHFLVRAIELGLNKSQVFSFSHLLADLSRNLIRLRLSFNRLPLILAPDQVESVILIDEPLVLSF